MFEQLPPHDIQAEESVVASVMVDPDAMDKVAGILQARDFFREINAWTARGTAIQLYVVSHAPTQG